MEKSVLVAILPAGHAIWRYNNRDGKEYSIITNGEDRVIKKAPIEKEGQLLNAFYRGELVTRPDRELINRIVYSVGYVSAFG